MISSNQVARSDFICSLGNNTHEAHGLMGHANHRYLELIAYSFIHSFIFALCRNW